MSAHGQPLSITVDLGGRSYPILIGAGLLPGAGARIKHQLGQRRCVIITDDNVARYHLADLEASLKAEDLHAGTLVLPAGEATKSIKYLEQVCEDLLELKLERGDLVVAFGGGVIGDLAGFAAGIVLRGVQFVQIPTTLLAQVDSSVGGKTGINARHGKNLIGVFHQPALVLADIDVLATLPAREFKAGYAEVYKYALILNPSVLEQKQTAMSDAPNRGNLRPGSRLGVRFSDWLDRHLDAIMAHDPAPLTTAIQVSCQTKAAVVAADEREAGQRALLNLGHTFGHALEAWANYTGRLLHGEAVSIGMVMAFDYSLRRGLCHITEANRVEQHLQRAGLPTRISQITGNVQPPTADELLAVMAQDKKVKNGRLTLILVRGLGRAFITQDVDLKDLESFLLEACAS